jgi:hypothetical protein
MSKKTDLEYQFSIESALEEAVSLGLAEAFIDPKGVRRYRITQLGTERIEALFKAKPEGNEEK